MRGFGIRECLIESEAVAVLTVHFERDRLHVHPRPIQAVTGIASEDACMFTGLEDRLPHMAQMTKSKTRLFLQISTLRYTTRLVEIGIRH